MMKYYFLLMGLTLALFFSGCASFDDSDTNYIAVVADRTGFFPGADCGRFSPPNGYLEAGTRVRIIETAVGGGECHLVEVGGRRGYVSRYDLRAQ
jgi:hypothetical protein